MRGSGGKYQQQGVTHGDGFRRGPVRNRKGPRDNVCVVAAVDRGGQLQLVLRQEAERVGHRHDQVGLACEETVVSYALFTTQAKQKRSFSHLQSDLMWWRAPQWPRRISGTRSLAAAAESRSYLTGSWTRRSSTSCCLRCGTSARCLTCWGCCIRGCTCCPLR